MPVAIVALVVGLLAGIAAVAVAAGLTPTEPSAPVDPRVRATWGRRVAAGAVTVVAATIGWAVTGWPVAAIGVIAAVWLVPSAVRSSRTHTRNQEQLDATRMWLMQMRSTLQAGTGLESSIRATAEQIRPDSPLSGPLQRLVQRLDVLPATAALRLFAAEIDNHVADTAVTVLTTALTHSQAGVARALQPLSEWAGEDLAHLRQVEAEARGLRLSRRIVLTIWVGLAVYLTWSSPDLMAPYATFTGQITLLVLGLFAAGAVWLLTYWSTVQRPERFFRHDTAEVS